MLYELDAYGDAVGQGATESRYCTIGGVAKVDGPGGSQLAVVNEFICGRLALLLGLPVPPGQIMQDASGTAVYVSLRFGKKGEKPPPVFPADLVRDHPKLAAGIVAFDCWVRNEDRNSTNMAYCKSPRIPPVIFDHERALTGLDRANLHQRLEVEIDAPGIAGCLVGEALVGHSLDEWVDVIRQVPASVVEITCHDEALHALLTQSEQNVVAHYLLTRRSKLGAMLRTLPNVPVWSPAP